MAREYLHVICRYTRTFNCKISFDAVACFVVWLSGLYNEASPNFLRWVVYSRHRQAGRLLLGCYSRLCPTRRCWNSLWKLRSFCRLGCGWQAAHNFRSTTSRYRTAACWGAAVLDAPDHTAPALYIGWAGTYLSHW